MMMWRTLMLAVAVEAASGVPPIPAAPFNVTGGVALFWEGLHGSACYRIPSILQTKLGTLLAFAVNRIDSCHDQSNHSLVLRRSTDMGSTWGPVITILQGQPPCAGCPAAISSPNPVLVSYQDGKSAVLLEYETFNNPTAIKHGYDMQIWSFDDGLTWVNSSRLAFPPVPNLGGLSGPAVGIQATNGAREIYFSLRQLTGEEFLIISSDYGASWRASRLAEGLSECSIAFVPGTNESRILANCRPDDQHQRRQQLWDRDGTPIGNFTSASGVFDPGCQGSLIAAGDSLYVSHASSTTERARMLVQKSMDGGNTWDKGVVIWPYPSGYSQLIALERDATERDPPGDEPLGLLFEAGCSRCHSWHFSQTIQFVRLPAAARDEELFSVL